MSDSKRAVQRERELKYSTTETGPPDEAELRAALLSANLELGPARTASVKDRYYDDPRLNLSRAGLALRRRMEDGKMVATLKTRGSVRGALHDRGEVELPVSDQDWPKPIHDRIAMITPPALLQPQTVIETERLSYAVLSAGRPLATLSFDSVSAKPQSGQRSVSFEEIEIEAYGETDDQTLEAIAGAVQSVMPLTPNAFSKLERARELLLLGEW